MWCVNRSTVVVKPWICLTWARSAEEELGLPLCIDGQWVTVLYRWSVVLTAAGGMVLCIPPFQPVLSSVCIANLPGCQCGWMCPPAWLWQGELSTIYLCTYWLEILMVLNKPESLFPPLIHHPPKYQQNSFEKEEAAKAYAKMILYFILLWK